MLNVTLKGTLNQLAHNSYCIVSKDALALRVFFTPKAKPSEELFNCGASPVITLKGVIHYDAQDVPLLRVTSPDAITL